MGKIKYKVYKYINKLDRKAKNALKSTKPNYNTQQRKDNSKLISVVSSSLLILLLLLIFPYIGSFIYRKSQIGFWIFISIIIAILISYCTYKIIKKIKQRREKKN